nr:reverse transcriptase domain-containing protein [Tanacetum cinerariifolium]
MTKYAKFMKDLLAKKGKAEETSKITLNERCSVVFLNKIPLKEKDPRSFTILYRFIFPVDFVVLDNEEDHKILIIIGRPFLANAHAMIDVFNKKISFKVGNETITFNIEESMKFSTPEDDTCLSTDMVDAAVLDHGDKNDEIEHDLDESNKSRLSPDHSGQPHRRLNPKVQDVVKTEIIKLLNAGLIYTISVSPWASPIHVVPKKGGMTIITNENNELVSTRIVTGWRVCIDYRKLNDETRKNHFPLPFIDQMLEILSINDYYCFLDGFSGYFQIPLTPQDQEKTTFTCPYETFAYRRMPFGMCNALATF